MKTASITDAKNRFSALIDEVRHGQPVIIVDRGRPVARLESVVSAGHTDPEGRMARLERQGLVVGSRRPAPRKLIAQPPPKSRKGVSAVAALVAERRSGR